MSKPNFTADDFEDIFEEFLSNFGGGANRQNGDLDLPLSLTLQEAMQGVQKTVTYQRWIACPTCDATGAAPGATAVLCIKCKGSGELRMTQQTFLGAVVRLVPCPDCKGLGKKVSRVCVGCQGTARISHEETLRVSIPTGIQEGTRIQIKEMGNVRRDNQYGNLFLRITFLSDSRLEARGNDVILRWQMNAHEYQAGKQLRVPTLDGDVLVTLPTLEQIEGKALRLRGRGLPDGQGRGDQFIHLEILSWQRSLQTVQQNLSNWIERFTQGKPKNKSKTMPIVDVEFSQAENPL